MVGARWMDGWMGYQRKITNKYENIMGKRKMSVRTVVLKKHKHAKNL